MKYNRLELLLLGGDNRDILDYQPLLKEYGVYLLDYTSFISYGKKLSIATKKEIINKIFNKEILLSKESKFSNGYFNWWDCAYSNTVVLFSFFHAKKGYEHEALEFILKSSLANYLPQFGLLENGTILNKNQVSKLISEIENKKRIELLESIAKYKFNPCDNVFAVFNIHSFSDEHFGKIETLEQLKTKFRELVKIHHPDKGGNELMLRAIISAKDFLKERIEINKIT